MDIAATIAKMAKKLRKNLMNALQRRRGAPYWYNTNRLRRKRLRRFRGARFLIRRSRGEG
jgi:hypothetical protein